jgi:hypothetical protein
MTDPPALHPRVARFLLEQIESVPHLEALLLMRDEPRRPWSVEETARRLYVAEEGARRVLDDLVQRRLVRTEPAERDVRYLYDPRLDPDDTLLELVADEYRRHLVQVATLIHSKPSVAIHDFARAFRLKKE